MVSRYVNAMGHKNWYRARSEGCVAERAAARFATRLRSGECVRRVPMCVWARPLYILAYFKTGEMRWVCAHKIATLPSQGHGMVCTHRSGAAMPWG